MHLVLFKDVLPLLRLRQGVNDNRELIDAVQSVALQVTEVASDLQSLAFKHAKTVAEAVQEAQPLIRALPYVGVLADSDSFAQVESLSSSIVDYATSAKSIIADVEDALIKSDASKLRKYISALRSIRTELERLLKA